MSHLYDRIPANVSPAQRAHCESELDHMACMMVHWFADRAFTCPESLQGTIDTYKNLIVARAHSYPEDEHGQDF